MRTGTAAAQLLQQQGSLKLPFYGFKSGQSWISCTSLFIDPARFAPAQKEPLFNRRFLEKCTTLGTCFEMLGVNASWLALANPAAFGPRTAFREVLLTKGSSACAKSSRKRWLPA